MAKVHLQLPVVQYTLQRLTGEQLPEKRYGSEIVKVSRLLSDVFKIKEILWSSRRTSPETGEEVVDVIFTSLPPSLARKTLNVDQVGELRRAARRRWESRV